MNRGGPTLVEFFGLPGSGKSTLREETSAAMSVIGEPAMIPRPFIYRKRSRARRAAYQAEFHSRYARIALLAYRLSLQSQHRGESIRLVPSLLVDVHRAQFALAQMEGRGVCLMDQGTLQQLRTLLKDHQGPDHDLARTLIEEIAAATGLRRGWMVVYLDSGPELASQRIQGRARKQGRFDRMTREERFNQYKNEHATATDLLSILESTEFTHVLEISSTQSAADSGRRVAEWISERGFIAD